ncbi:DUF2267 domain-containing protein [Desulfocurvibacter africanus]|uniref:DUF2267 domain-containing protein n=1 Tax=Desulfocurvibacter africanus TaxID=873 RepID=UPI000404CF84|nr:DUF2267 domain-containing protein [Desulfocurvibacter africanus]
MTTQIPAFDNSIIKTKEWLKDIREDLHLDDDQQAYVVLRAVLHVLRDRLVPDEACDMAAQFPMLVRGFFFEGWKPTGRPMKIDTEEEFLGRVQHELHRQNTPKLTDPRRITIGVLHSLEKHVSGGELNKVIQSLPKQLRNLWQQAA